MVRLMWDPSMETGNDRIDEQHREMVDLLNQAEAADEAGSGDAETLRILDKIAAHITDHFAMEENLMRCTPSYEPERFAEHLEEHRALTARSRELILDFRAGKMEGVRPLTQFLWNWIIRHEYETDRRLVDCIREEADSAAG